MYKKINITSQFLARRKLKPEYPVKKLPSFYRKSLIFILISLKGHKGVVDVSMLACVRLWVQALIGTNRRL